MKKVIQQKMSTYFMYIFMAVVFCAFSLLRAMDNAHVSNGYAMQVSVEGSQENVEQFLNRVTAGSSGVGTSNTVSPSSKEIDHESFSASIPAEAMVDGLQPDPLKASCERRQFGEENWLMNTLRSKNVFYPTIFKQEKERCGLHAVLNAYACNEACKVLPTEQVMREQLIHLMNGTVQELVAHDGAALMLRGNQESHTTIFDLLSRMNKGEQLDDSELIKLCEFLDVENVSMLSAGQSDMVAPIQDRVKRGWSSGWLPGQSPFAHVVHKNQIITDDSFETRSMEDIQSTLRAGGVWHFICHTRANQFYSTERNHWILITALCISGCEPMFLVFNSLNRPVALDFIERGMTVQHSSDELSYVAYLRNMVKEKAKSSST